MFVAVGLDLSSSDHKQRVELLLSQYGFKRMQEGLFEHTSITENQLKRLKRDLDNTTDYYDRIRIYQYPLENTLVISSLKNKKWTKLIARL